MFEEYALETMRSLGREFARAYKKVLGKDLGVENELLNGLAAYEKLNLKGVSDELDFSFNIVMGIVARNAVEQLEKDQLAK